jgi:hypothetical protein
VLLCLFSGPALAETKGASQTKSESGDTTKDRSACPSREFAAFFQAFSRQAELQRRYTRLPLQHGILDIDVTPDVFRKKMIGRFEEIPQYNKQTMAIFPSAARIKAEKLEIEIRTSKSPKPHKGAPPESTVENPNNAVALLYLPDTGFQVYYRFRRAAGCWFLIGISDRST